VPHSLLHFGLVAVMSLLWNSCAPVKVSVDTEGSPAAAVATHFVSDHPADSAGGDRRADEYRTRSGQKVYGYFAWWTRDLWQDLDLSIYDKIFFFDLTPAADGFIRERNGYPTAWQRLVAQADRYAVPVVPSIALLDADTLQAIFLNPEHRNNLLRSSLSLIEDSGGAGLHLDYEWFAPASEALREGFHAYLDALANEVSVRFPQARLSLFVPAFQPAGMVDIGRIPSAYADVIVQGYDMHWLTSPVAGPLSPLTGWNGSNWQSILRAMDTGPLGRERMFLTVPYYGYEWPTESEALGSATRGVACVTSYAPMDASRVPDIQLSSTERARQFGRGRDPISGSPYYVYADSTGWHQGWYEDRESLDAKYRFVKEEGLAGIAIFLIGYDAGQMDSLLLERFGTRQVRASRNR